jgi:NADH-quinone oxidoreductase subunit I
MVGAGVLKGMAVTFREFLGTYPVGRWMLRMLRMPPGDGLFTIQYPETRQQHAERFRYFPFLVYDGTPDNLRCVACKICEQECPPKCIFIEPARDEQDRPLKAHGRAYPNTFDIDTSICMSCRICVDVCPFDAIEMDNQYEMAAGERAKGMLFTKDALLKSNEYFQRIKPTEAAVVDQRLAAKSAKKAQPP